ncbi:MAG: sugar transferase [Lentisphaeria bacterium]|nr:sugar transferase [Lentisphaeria bacterium]NQZ66787.1 sugar transferase [Lentisphaeria bacterium]
MKKASHARSDLIDELYHLYGDPTSKRWNSFSYRRKKYLWIFIVGGSRSCKRLLDIVISVCALLVLIPLLILVSILIKCTDWGPILFWQMRVGLWGREFPFPKFRSMVVNADKLKDAMISENDHGKNITFKMKKDPRVTWIGRIIRRLSIDELPQFWSVLIGDLSLVGPRPAVPREVCQYTLHDRRRLDVKPGLTCFWQVSGRGDIPFPEQVRLDVKYIESQSLLLDFKLLLLTIPAVLSGKGAY